MGAVDAAAGGAVEVMDWRRRADQVWVGGGQRWAEREEAGHHGLTAEDEEWLYSVTVPWRRCGRQLVPAAGKPFGMPAATAPPPEPEAAAAESPAAEQTGEELAVARAVGQGAGGWGGASAAPAGRAAGAVLVSCLKVLLLPRLLPLTLLPPGQSLAGQLPAVQDGAG